MLSISPRSTWYSYLIINSILMHKPSTAIQEQNHRETFSDHTEDVMNSVSLEDERLASSDPSSLRQVLQTSSLSSNRPTFSLENQENLLWIQSKIHDVKNVWTMSTRLWRNMLLWMIHRPDADRFTRESLFAQLFWVCFIRTLEGAGLISLALLRGVRLCSVSPLILLSPVYLLFLLCVACLLDCFIPSTCSQPLLSPWLFHSLHLPSATPVSLIASYPSPALSHSCILDCFIPFTCPQPLLSPWLFHSLHLPSATPVSLIASYPSPTLSHSCILDCFIPFTCPQPLLSPWLFHSLHLPAATIVSLINSFPSPALSHSCLLDCFIPFTCPQPPFPPLLFHSLHLPSATPVSLIVSFPSPALSYSCLLECSFPSPALSHYCLLDCFIPFTCPQLLLSPWLLHSLHLPSATLVSFVSHVVHLSPLYILCHSFHCWIVFFPSSCCSCYSCVFLILPVSTLPALTPHSLPFPFWTFCLFFGTFASLKSVFCYPYRVLFIPLHMSSCPSLPLTPAVTVETVFISFIHRQINNH